MTSKILEQAQQIRQRADRDLAAMRSRRESADGWVHAEVNGHRQLLAVRIDRRALDPQQSQQLSASLIEAVNAASGEMTRRLYERLGKSATDLPRLTNPPPTTPDLATPGA